MESKDEILSNYNEEEREQVVSKANSQLQEIDYEIHSDLIGFDDVAGESGRNSMVMGFINDGLKDNTINSEKNTIELSKKIVHFIFRNGYVEKLHAGKFLIEEYENIPKGTPLEMISQLTEEDMENLNKYMMDRVGYLLKLFQGGEYTKLSYLLGRYSHEGRTWDEPNTRKIEEQFEDILLINDWLDRKDY